MANRNDPGVRQHETLPGPGPGRKTLSLPVGVRPVEQMMDAAIERIEREHHASYVPGPVAGTHALALPEPLPEHGAPTRLRWKGLDVSDEFRSYAERVARGEDLPPFAGRVLAEPNAEFPWGSAARGERVGRPGRGGQIALWASAAVVMGLLAWSVALKFEAIEPPLALINVAAPAVDALAARASFSAPAPRELGASPSLQASNDAPRVESAPAHPSPTAEPVPQPHVMEPAATVPQRPAAVPSTPLAPAAVAAVPVSVAPAAPEPAPAPPPALPSVLAAAPAQAPATAVPASAPKPASSARLPDVDFGIDELPLAASRNPAAAAAESGSIGDLDRVGSPPTSAARKEPGKESSAKGSLLVDTPSF